MTFLQFFWAYTSLPTLTALAISSNPSTKYFFRVTHHHLSPEQDNSTKYSASIHINKYKYLLIEYHSPSAFGDHHLRPKFMELLPKVLPFERDLRVIHDPVLLRLDCPQRPHHSRMVIVRRHGRKNDVFRSGVRMSRERVVRMRMVDLRNQRSRVAPVRVLTAERRERRRREVSRRSRRRSRWSCRVVRRRQQGTHAEVRLAGQLQEWVVGHRALQFRV